MARELVKKGAGAATNEEKLGESIDKVQAILSKYRTALKTLRDKRKTYTQLESVSQGLYDEIDKLSKKSHVGLLTDLALSRVNDTIRVAKELMDDDPYIAKIAQFVAAGDNPSHGDAVVDLRQIRQGLSRYNHEMESNEKRLRSIINACQGIIYALEYRKANGMASSKSDLIEYGIPSVFFVKDISGFTHFDHDKIALIDMEHYFEEDFNEK
jgi:DNA repair exonuclease SbcCD ATPase subunit